MSLTFAGSLLWFGRFQHYFSPVFLVPVPGVGTSSGRGRIMRKYLCVVGLMAAMAWAGSVHAQTPGSSSIFNIFKIPNGLNINVQPNITSNAPMDYRNQNAPIGSTIVNPPNNGTSFPLRMSQYFYTAGRSNYIASSTTWGTSTLPTPAQLQASAPSYFSAFQMYRAAPIGR
jgi:hypothetical protein